MELEDPRSLPSRAVAQCSFQPQQPVMRITVMGYGGFSRVAIMGGCDVVMLAKVISLAAWGCGRHRYV